MTQAIVRRFLIKAEWLQAIFDQVRDGPAVTQWADRRCVIPTRIDLWEHEMLADLPEDAPRPAPRYLTLSDLVEGISRAFNPLIPIPDPPAGMFEDSPSFDARLAIIYALLFQLPLDDYCADMIVQLALFNQVVYD